MVLSTESPNRCILLCYSRRRKEPYFYNQSQVSNIATNFSLLEFTTEGKSPVTHYCLQRFIFPAFLYFETICLPRVGCYFLVLLKLYLNSILC